MQENKHLARLPLVSFSSPAWASTSRTHLGCEGQEASNAAHGGPPARAQRCRRRWREELRGTRKSPTSPYGSSLPFIIVRCPTPLRTICHVGVTSPPSHAAFCRAPLPPRCCAATWQCVSVTPVPGHLAPASLTSSQPPLPLLLLPDAAPWTLVASRTQHSFGWAYLVAWNAHFPHWRPSTHSLRLSSRATSTVTCPASPRQALGLLLQSSLHSLCFTALHITMFITLSPQINFQLL